MQDTNTQNVKWLIFLVSATGGFLAMLDSNTINVALYEIAKDFNADINAVQKRRTVGCNGIYFDFKLVFDVVR